MKNAKQLWLTLICCSVGASMPVSADEFTAADQQRWMNEYMSVVKQGEKFFRGGLKAKNTVSCDQC